LTVERRAVGLSFVRYSTEDLARMAQTPKPTRNVMSAMTAPGAVALLP